MYRLELIWTLVFTGTVISCGAQITSSYDVQYVSQRSDCESPPPTAELSSRSRDVGPFSEWSLRGHIAGNCTNIQSRPSIQNGTQFRVELSPAASCWCVTVTVGESDAPGLVQGNNFNCGTNQPNGSMLCAQQNQTTSFLSMIVTIEPIKLAPDSFDIQLQECSAIMYSTYNSQDIAIAYQNMFEPLACQNTCSTFPLIPVSKTTEKLINVTIHFSMILKYNNPMPTDCANLNAANEGILLKANSSDSTHYLHFYYGQNTHKSTGSRVPLVEILANQTLVNLTYSNESFVVSGTFVKETGLRNFSLDITQLKEVVSITWEQHARTPAGHECDLWSLDNVFVIAKSGTRNKTIFSEDFQNMHAYGWTRMSSVIDHGNTICSVNNSYCLYSKGRNDISDNFRFARTPPIDFRPVTAVKPSPAPLTGSLQCQDGLKPLLVKFQLQFRKFPYPSVSTSSAPNTVVLSVSELGPQAHYAPVADTNWPFFNAAEKYFYSSAGNIPVYSPHPNQVTMATACVNVTDRKSLEIIWRQDEFKSGFDLWYLHIDEVILDNFSISDLIRKTNSESYILSKFNDEETAASICGITADFGDIFSLTGNDTSAPRLVNLTLDVTHIFPIAKPIICPSDGIWNATTNCTVSNAESCFNNATLRTRICHCNGSWGPVHCTHSLALARELIEISPVQGLDTLISVPQYDVTNMERFRILDDAFKAALSEGITQRFVKDAVQILLDAIDAAENTDDYDSLPDLFSLVDRVARELRQNITINTASYVLKVEEVYHDRESFRPIKVDNNYIMLPSELFSELTESEFLVSIYFKNISHLLPNNTVSPVIASSCESCKNYNLDKNVTVFFDLPLQNDSVSRCMFINLQNVSRDGKFWIDDGCTTITFDNGSIMCSCNHLTHFAILLSPGVSIPIEHQRALTVIGQVFVAISLVFLAITFFAYVLQRSLWNMRNYIHCMLCVNLFAAQLVFVVGVERTENEAVCSAIAILLHYLFLVVFMWMLMEGVVLYVALVRVFVKHTLRYIIAFTIVSYGVPLVYIGAVAPVGLLVSTNGVGNHYGLYNETSGQILACWLRYDTHFILAMIIPVVLIIILNLGFMTMALVVMRRHLKKGRKKSEVDIARHWLKVIISLVIVMGIAWIGNLLFFDINLLFIAYIMTIFIAGQGLIIFILFVPLSKQVREAYTKWWKMKQSQSTFLSRVFRSSLLHGSSGEKSKKQHKPCNGGYELGTFDRTKSPNRSSEELHSREYDSIPQFTKEESSSVSREEDTARYQTISKDTPLFSSKYNALVQSDSSDTAAVDTLSTDKETGQLNGTSYENECYYETISTTDEDNKSTHDHEYQTFNVEFN